MSIFKIPFFQRYTALGGLSSFVKKRKYLSVDGIGMLVFYDEENQLAPEAIRRNLLSARSGDYFVEAENLEEALEIFRKLEGFNTGEKKRALWIDESEEILKLPHCNLLNKNNKEEFICGESNDEGQGIFGVCVLQGGGYDYPKECPIAPILQTLAEAKWM